jgi:hypothetical protein
MKPIKEKILVELKTKLDCKTLVFGGQDKFFWYFENEDTKYRVFKMYTKLMNKHYSFKWQEDINKGEFGDIGIVQVGWEINDNANELWKDPEPIRPASLIGIRIRLHRAYTITQNIYEAFYLVSNEIYNTTLGVVIDFDEKKGSKFHEAIIANNMLKLFQAFEYFKKDIENDADIHLLSSEGIFEVVS